VVLLARHELPGRDFVDGLLAGAQTLLKTLAAPGIALCAVDIQGLPQAEEVLRFCCSALYTVESFYHYCCRYGILVAGKDLHGDVAVVRKRAGK
jgi:hypothetical protein